MSHGQIVLLDSDLRRLWYNIGYQPLSVALSLNEFWRGPGIVHRRRKP